MTIPALIFGLILSTLYGAVFHLIKGGGAGKLLLYLSVSWAGFWLGQFVASRFGLTLFSIGPLHLGIATLASFAFLFLGHWLSLSDQNNSCG